MTRLDYKVGEKIFTSSQYEKAKREAKRQGTLIIPIYTPIDTMPKANPERIAKLREARQKKIIERVMNAVGA